MSGNYSCFDVPVDLSLSGSQVSPTQKVKPTSARSSSSRVNSSSKLKQTHQHHQPNSSRNVKTSHSDIKHLSKDKNPFSLAASFPVKENRHPQQTNVPKAVDNDYLDSFFKQSSSRLKAKPRPSSYKEKKKSKYHEERVFEIPDSARSESVCSEAVLSSRNSVLDVTEEDGMTSRSLFDNQSGSGDANVDYLKSYLSNMDKYRDTSETHNIHYNLSKKLQSSEDNFAEERSIRLSAHSPVLHATHSVERNKEDLLLDEKVKHLQRNRSARKIQVWYRRHSNRRKRSEAVMKRMLSQKKEELESNPLRESLQISQRSEEEKKKQREERAREARKQAIKELQEKRKTEKERIRRVAQEEVDAVRKRVEAEKRRSARSRASSRVSNTSSGKLDQRKGKDAVDSAPNKSASQTIATSLHTAGEPADKENREVDTEVAVSKTAGDLLKSHTTLDDVLETIKKLEEPEHFEKPKSALDEKLAWIDDLQVELQSNVSKVSEKTRTPVLADTTTLLTEAKLQSINNYLDDIEKSEATPVEEKDTTEQLIQAEKTATEVTSELLKLRLEVEEKSRSVSLLQNALVQQRDLNSKQSKQLESDFTYRMKLQKDQYESTIQRHLSFIDQLIDDKKALNEKCEKVVLEMKQADTKYQKKIKELSESHHVELKKSKDVLAAAEKLRREKWIDEKTKKIKEMTVKGLEPEIQRLIAKHKEEMKKVKAVHEAELLRSDERAGQRYIRQTEELREQLEREKEAACTREREMARQRYEKQMEQEEIALQQQRKRLFAEVAEEKERINQQATRHRSELEELKQQIEGNSRIAASTLREEFEKSADEMQRRHKDELKALHDRLEIEKQAWQENYMKKQEAFMMQKERELKEAVRRDRDKEIEVAILRLEDDMHQQREELEKTTENRIKRIRDKYEAEMREVERSERQTQEKYNTMKADFNEIESENLRLQSLCKEKEQEVTDTNKIKKKLVEERGNVSEVIRQEFADRLVITDEENKRMKAELSELRARQRLELERISNEKEEELAEVHKRVRQAIIKKEETISQIREQYDAAVKRADHLESLLEQQRKKVLGKKK